MTEDRIWPGKAGPVRVADMTNSHLLAAIAWAERNADRIRFHRAFMLDSAAASVGGEYASYDLESAASRLYEAEDPNEWWDEYRWLLDEAEKRQLLKEGR